MRGKGYGNGQASGLLNRVGSIMILLKGEAQETIEPVLISYGYDHYNSEYKGASVH